MELRLTSVQKPIPKAAPWSHSQPPEHAAGGMRALVEWLILLALAVVIFRGFALEGYMVSTGSMAPCLLGYHNRVTCPACHLEFACGAAPPDDAFQGAEVRGDASVGIASTADSQAHVACPNCGQTGIPLGSFSRTEGDQLLVHKNAFAWRERLRGQGPRRWEVAVFRSPEDATTPYVKRVVGLPGEQLELKDGDVYVDGRLARKPLATQLGIRIPVTLHDFQPDDDDPDWRPRWSSVARNSNWTSDGSRFLLKASGATAPSTAGRSPETASLDWIEYRHWQRAGGIHRSSVELSAWPEGVEPPNPLLSSLEYDAEPQRLTCFGALPHRSWRRWDEMTDDEEFRRAVRRLYVRSHVAPLTNTLEYNHSHSDEESYPVRDLMLELELEWKAGTGLFVMEMTDGANVFYAEFDFGRDQVRITADGVDKPLRTAPLPPQLRRRPVILIMSTFDRQILLACDDAPICEPFRYEESEDSQAALQRPVSFGGAGLDAAVNHVGLFRDVYYTPARDRPTQQFQLGADEFFMLGDNSAVSVDSRHWTNPGLRRELLIGRPLVVHLPSRPARFQIGNRTRTIRVPDFSRIRYIQ
ncbi:MAG: S26 family signal peptidase [Planctomycetota bacterium]|nr:MAG: S26 family signal peptidase [Planctomycetota bacterium]REJ93135.1 MAG: S26 family signal peptidase [Planctomycetota bacterium]